jgi:hypothetical protein
MDKEQHGGAPGARRSRADDALYDSIADQMVGGALDHAVDDPGPVDEPPGAPAADATPLRPVAETGADDVYEETAEKLIEGMVDPEAVSRNGDAPEPAHER